MSVVSLLQFKSGMRLARNFRVADPFFRVSKSVKESGPGYWKFDGFDIDVEGEFVPLEPADKSDSEHTELFGIWNKTAGTFPRANRKPQDQIN